MQKGSKGKKVQELQIMLNLVLAGNAAFTPLLADGDFGAKTEAAVRQFCKFISNDQSDYKFADSFIVGALQNHFSKLRKFVVVLDAGHGGIDPKTGEYTTPADNGKRYQHPNTPLHTPDGWFYEGVKNRIVANATAKACKENGILAITASHPFLDFWGTTTNSDEWKRRGTFAAPYYAMGFDVIFHSIHSNAAPTSVEEKGKKRKRTKAELDAIRGMEGYTIEADNLSDKVLPILTEAWVKRFGKVLRGGGEKEADFAVILHAEKTAKAYGCKNSVAILTEEFVFTSEPDAKLLCEQSTIDKLVECNLEFYTAVRDGHFKR